MKDFLKNENRSCQLYGTTESYWIITDNSHRKKHCWIVNQGHRCSFGSIYSKFPRQKFCWCSDETWCFSFLHFNYLSHWHTTRRLCSLQWEGRQDPWGFYLYISMQYLSPKQNIKTGVEDNGTELILILTQYIGLLLLYVPIAIVYSLRSEKDKSLQEWAVQSYTLHWVVTQDCMGKNSVHGKVVWP